MQSIEQLASRPRGGLQFDSVTVSSGKVAVRLTALRAEERTRIRLPAQRFAEPYHRKRLDGITCIAALSHQDEQIATYDIELSELVSYHRRIVRNCAPVAWVPSRLPANVPAQDLSLPLQTVAR